MTLAPAPALLLDTHIVLWLSAGDERLRPATRALIEECWKEGGEIWVSAVSAWEIALLADRGHIELDLEPEAWLHRFLDRPGVAEARLNYRVAARAYQLPGFVGQDPADRLLISTAIDLDCPLVTYDRRIAEFARCHGRQHRFRVLA